MNLINNIINRSLLYWDSTFNISFISIFKDSTNTLSGLLFIDLTFYFLFLIIVYRSIISSEKKAESLISDLKNNRNKILHMDIKIKNIFPMDRVYFESDLNSLFTYLNHPFIQRQFNLYDCDIETHTRLFNKKYFTKGRVFNGFSMAPYEQIIVCKLRLYSSHEFFFLFNVLRLIASSVARCRRVPLVITYRWVDALGETTNKRYLYFLPKYLCFEFLETCYYYAQIKHESVSKFLERFFSE